MKHNLSAIAGLLLTALAVSCNSRPEGVLSEGEMVDLMTDIQLADAYYNTTTAGPERPDRAILMESILKKHGVTRTQLDSTISYYGRNLDDYAALFDKVEKRLKAQSGKGQSEKSESEDDIWPYQPYAVLLPGQISDGIIFSIPADGLEPGNMLEWKMRLTSADGVEIMLGVEYDNGSTSYFKKSAAGNRNLRVELQTDTAYLAKRIFGSITAPQSAMPLWTDSIRLLKTPFDSLTYSKIQLQHRMRGPKKKEKHQAPDTLSSQSVSTGKNM